ncbi:alpha/beta hydrolase [Paraburkholderia fungorum]|uniref:alpha/beta fold hydrolase n=1 Tax=Paraburkholderia fungorum TaxID=134537 RepID=UPI0038BD849B
MSLSATIVLVHGALTDASVWNGVLDCLAALGQPAVAPAMPLRGLHTDAAYLSSFLKTVTGPTVLVGHSYGGTVISHPQLEHGNVAALVYVAAFAPDAGESTGELNGRWPGSRLGEATTVLREHPDGVDLYLKPEHFVDVYGGDLEPAIAYRMAVAQRPLDTRALGDTFDGAPLWRTIPSWALLATQDNSLPVAAQRAMAERAGSKTVEIAASHATPVANPQAVLEVIQDALRSA